MPSLYSSSPSKLSKSDLGASGSGGESSGGSEVQSLRYGLKFELASSTRSCNFHAIIRAPGSTLNTRQANSPAQSSAARTCRSEHDKGSEHTESCQGQACMHVAEHLSESAVCLLERSKARILCMCIELLASASRHFTPYTY